MKRSGNLSDGEKKEEAEIQNARETKITNSNITINWYVSVIPKLFLNAF